MSLEVTAQDVVRRLVTQTLAGKMEWEVTREDTDKGALHTCAYRAPGYSLLVTMATSNLRIQSIPMTCPDVNIHAPELSEALQGRYADLRTLTGEVYTNLFKALEGVAFDKVSAPKVGGELSLVKVRTNSHFRWRGTEERRLARGIREKMSTEELAEELGRTVGAITGKASRMGLTTSRTKVNPLSRMRWTSTEEEELRSRVEEQETYSSISQGMGRSTGALRLKYKQLQQRLTTLL